MSQRLAVLQSALSPSRPLKLADVGANPLGDAPYKPLLEAGLCEVVGFEPNPEAFAKLEAQKGPAETYFETAVGSGARRELHLHKRSGFGSLFPLDGSALRQIGKEFWLKGALGTIAVDPRPLDRIEGMPKIDVLKMDLQGGELDVLEGGTKTLSDTIAIVTEARFHRIYEDEPMFGDLDVAMRKAGFKLYKFLFTKSVMMPHAAEEDIIRGRMTSQLLDGDAVYLRDGQLDEDLSDDQLAWLAFLADTMLEAPDLCLFALTALQSRGTIGQKAIADYVTALPRRMKEK